MFATPEKKYDVILVAGEGKNSYQVYDQHKAFLRLEGKCVITHVLESLQGAKFVNNIYVVGPRESILQNFREDAINLEYPKKIFVCEQKKNLFENVWFTFKQTLGKLVDDKSLENSIHKDKVVLVVPCDSPLITSHEIDYFINHANMKKYDYVLGLTPEDALRPFYPQKGIPGIKMAYLHLKEKNCRINNLHLVRPVKIRNRHYIQQMYQFRYLRNLKNVVLFGIELIGKDKIVRYRYYIGLMLGLILSRLKLEFLNNWVRALVPKKELETCISSIMNTRFTGLEVPFPGAAMDIDNVKDFEAIKVQFKNWKEYLARLNERFPLPEGGLRKMPREPSPANTSPTASLSEIKTEIAS